MTDIDVYRIHLSRHRDRVDGCSEHYTLIRVLRDGREVGRAHSHQYESFADAISSARVRARAEARFLRSLGSVFSAEASRA